MSKPVQSNVIPSPSMSTQASLTTIPTVSTVRPSSANLHTTATTNFDAIFADTPTTTNVTPVPPRPPLSTQTPLTHPRNNEVTARKSAPELGRKSDITPSANVLTVPKREPPSREVTQTHHKHHVITVDSETDFTKMHIDEKKVNYLLYNPPVSVSQTGLIQSIGKPFNPNHAKYLPDPGDEFKLTRRVSQVRLHQVCILGDVNHKIVDSLAATIKLLSILIGVVGLVFFCFVLSIAAIQTPMEYPLYFLDSHPVCKAAHIAGVVQPMIVAPYCRYALINLKHIRSYFLRVPIALGVPVGVIVCGLTQFTGAVKTDGELKTFLNERMEHYFGDTYISRYSRNTWDGIQNSFSCCGYESPRDWKAYNQTEYPKSCCNEHGICDANSTSLKSSGCYSAYKGSNIPIALVFVVLGAATIGLEIFSIILLRSLWACIGKELYDERSSLTIVGGKLCSLCDIEETDDEMEYDLPPDPHHDSSNEEDHHEEPDKKPKPEAHEANKLPKPAASTTAHKPATGVANTQNAPKKSFSLMGLGRGRGKVNKVAPA